MNKRLRWLRARLHTHKGVRAIFAFALAAFTVNLSLTVHSWSAWSARVPVQVQDPILQRVIYRRYRRSVVLRAQLIALSQSGGTVIHPAAPSASGVVLVPPVERVPALVPQSAVSSATSAAASVSSSASSSFSTSEGPQLVVPSSAPPAPSPAYSSVAFSSSSSESSVLPAPSPTSSSAAAASSSAVGSSSSAPQPVVPASPSSTEAFPVFGSALFPVSRVPNWGAMTTPAEWDRSYAQMERTDFVSIPRYDLSVLTIPVSDLEDRRTPEEISSLTAKLFYSTRYYGAYDLDAGEFTGAHPGIDLKLALGTPIGAVGGGIVRYAGNSGLLGLHVIIEHRMPDGSAYYSIYGHFGSISVHEGDTVRSGQTLGAVGMTGSTSGPHLHLQIDRGEPGEVHVPYTTTSVPSREAVRRWTVNPITFIRG